MIDYNFINYDEKRSQDEIDLMKDIPDIEENETPEIVKDSSSPPVKIKTDNELVTEMEDEDNWYDKWRKDNL